MRGFSIVELLIVVAVIGILSAVGVVAYNRYVNRSRQSEVFAMIGAIRSAQEAYKAESSRYLGTGTSETDFYPVLGSSGREPSRKSWDPAAHGKTSWQSLAVSSPSKGLYCGYVVVAGAANDLTGAGARGITLFNNQAPSRAWYYIRAECDFDGKSGTNSSYETTFDNEVVFVDNEGS
ncbi:MAG: prepilin-type N-terminal cleavage/methylation domain-containing protein [Polyangia bacterium]|nr:prepilin-type N-terminal cleavage/methylation domain-containing protein [Polyangia bacterium]